MCCELLTQYMTSINENKTKDVLQRDKQVNIFVTGNKGAGKSSLINAIIGECEMIETGFVSYSIININGVKFKIWESSGLQDLTKTDDEIINKITTQIKQECTHIHLLLYCLRMDKKESDDELKIKRVTDCFGPEIWETSIIALTFANMVLPPKEMDIAELSPIYFEQKLAEYKCEIIQILRKYQMNERKATEIAVIPTEYYKPTRMIPNHFKLPDREDWFNKFWITCVDRMKNTALGLVPLLLSRKDFVKLDINSKTKVALRKESDFLVKELEEKNKKIERLSEQVKRLQNKLLEADQETQHKLRQKESEMKNKFKIELEKLKDTSRKEADLHEKEVEQNKKKLESLRQQQKYIIRENENEMKSMMQEREAMIRLEEKDKWQKKQLEAKQEKKCKLQQIEGEQEKIIIKEMKDLDPHTIAKLVSIIKDVFTNNIAKLSTLLQNSIEVFVTEMLQEQLIARVVSRNPKYTTVIDNFLAKLAFITKKEAIEQHCSKFLKVLHSIGEQEASKNMKQQLTNTVKTKLNIDLYLDKYYY